MNKEEGNSSHQRCIKQQLGKVHSGQMPVVCLMDLNLEEIVIEIIELESIKRRVVSGWMFI